MAANKYVKSLDGYRGVAVILVILGHWLPEDNLIRRIFPVAFLGVRMFYVLSGFLITSILFSANDSIRAGKTTVGRAFRVFYARRTLRIFPVYYLTLLLVGIFYPYLLYRYPFLFHPYRVGLIWFLTYSTNIYMYLYHSYLMPFSHFWSLAVEEQFYLMWPLIIIFCKPKYFFRLIVFVILACFVFKLVMVNIPGELGKGDFYSVLVFSCMDCFGLGALLSLYICDKEKFPGFEKILKWLSLISFLLFVFMYNTGHTANVLYFSLMAVFSAYIILILLDEKRFVTKVFFSNPFLVYIGKISYSVYLFHNLVPSVYQVFSVSFQLNLD